MPRRCGHPGVGDVVLEVWVGPHAPEECDRAGGVGVGLDVGMVVFGKGIGRGTKAFGIEVGINSMQRSVSTLLLCSSSTHPPNRYMYRFLAKSTR